MAKLVTKFKYLKPGARKGAGGYAKYIATREGVEKIDDSQRLALATKQQEKLIAKILKDFPDSASLPEYGDYQAAPNMGNASEFISRALEDIADEMLSSKTYADYIATRPRAQRFGSHGLFTDDGVQVRLEKVSEELNLHKGNVWTAIFSLRREDEERLGFNSGERWRDLLRAQTQELSEAFHIPMTDLKWFAAFHNEGHHPHVHMIVYSTNPKEGYLSPKGVEQYQEHPEELVYKAKAEKYAKIISKTIILSGMDAASFGQNAYFYDAAEGLLTATILLVAEFCEPAKRHIVSVFKIIQELLAPSNKKGKNQFQQLMGTTEKQKKVPRRGDLLPLLSQLAADERGDLTRF